MPTNVALTGLARDLAARAEGGKPIRIGLVGAGEMGTDIVSPRYACKEGPAGSKSATFVAAMRACSRSLLWSETASECSHCAPMQKRDAPSASRTGRSESRLAKALPSLR